MNKIFNLALALVLFCTSANAVGLEIPTSTKKFFPTNVGEKNRANSGTDYVTPLAEGIQMILSNDGRLNMPASEFFRLKAKELSEESGKTVTADDVKKMLANHEYEIMTNAEFEKRFGFRPTNYAIYKSSATIEEETDFYDPNRNVAVLTPKMLPGYYSPFVADTCVNYQGGVAYEPTGDNDQDYSLPQSGSDATATATATVGDVDVTVYTGETEDEGGNTFIENYYEAGDAASGYGDYGFQPDPSLYWSLSLGWSQCGGWSFNGGLSNSPYGVGGYNSGYSNYGGYNSGYCGSGGFYDYSTTNNYFGDINSHNNNNSGNTTYNIHQWWINHQNDDDPPITTDGDDLPTNTGGTDDLSGTDGLPGNTAGTNDPLPGKKANPDNETPKGFKKDYKKSAGEGKDVEFAKNENKKIDAVKSNNQAGTKVDPQKEQPEFYASSNPKVEFRKAEKQNGEQPQGTQTKTKPEAKKEFKKVDAGTKTTSTKKYEQPVKQDGKQGEVKTKPEAKKEVKQPVKKSTTVKGDSAKNKPNSSAKKSTGARYEKPTSRKSAGSGQNYKTRDSGSSPKRTRG